MSFLARLGLPGLLGDLDGPGLIDRLDALERLKAAAAAEQARVQVEFALLCEAGMDPRAAALESRTGRAAARAGERSASAQIALARRVSPARGARLLAAARRLVADLPCTLGALSAGQLSEDRAVWVAEGVEVLSPAERAAVDEALAGHPRRLEGLGDRGVQDAVRAAVDAVDDRAAAARARRAGQGRRVTLRRLPDAMAQLTAILPAAQAAAVAGALRAAGAGARAAGDSRTAGQVAADTLVERVTGQEHADAVPLRVGLVMTDSSLFGAGREPALLQGYGRIPAGHARAMVAATATGTARTAAAGTTAGTARMPAGAAADGTLSSAAGASRNGPAGAPPTGTAADPSESAAAVASGMPRGPAAVPADGPGGLPAGGGRSGGAASLAGVWLRRLYLDPGTGELAAMDSRLRRFPRALAEFIQTRDQACRTPYCEAPIRHIDHVVPVASGGETSVENGQGLCEACNHAKESPGWERHVVGCEDPDGTRTEGTRGDILTVTPTGHEYYSPPPKLPGSDPYARRREHAPAQWEHAPPQWESVPQLEYSPQWWQTPRRQHG
ncbi:HNH endonuclease [Sinomonas terrae]|uniref:HNH endonuclease n=1 Tax=Sinomonas terrae TaxID=2908838 RepID=A0ABS9TWE7_9MICC|nr:HNH endonuclease signature motif containing protein [Sinomonas terrae]MCH6468537.1 HNH endonuclease [Sinomonas terrae]